MTASIMSQLHQDRRIGDWEAYINGMGSFVNITKIHHDKECTAELSKIEHDKVRRLKNEGTDRRTYRLDMSAITRVAVEIADSQEATILKCLKRNRLMDFSIKKGEF